MWCERWMEEWKVEKESKSASCPHELTHILPSYIKFCFSFCLSFPTSRQCQAKWFNWFYSVCCRLSFYCYVCRAGWIWSRIRKEKLFMLVFCSTVSTFSSPPKHTRALITIHWYLRRKRMIHKNMIHKNTTWSSEKHWSRRKSIKFSVFSLFFNVFSLQVRFTFTPTHPVCVKFQRTLFIYVFVGAVRSSPNKTILRFYLTVARFSSRNPFLCRQPRILFCRRSGYSDCLTLIQMTDVFFVSIAISHFPRIFLRLFY